MRVALTNLGCKLNQAETEELARRFASAGHRVVTSVEEAQVHVINSCTVTQAAARDSRKTARRGARRNAVLRTVLTGCYVESDPEEAAALAGVDLVVANRDKERLLERLHQAFPELALPERTLPDRTPAAAFPDLPCQPLAFGNARGLVKIEDGCDMSCAFCIIPATRGRQRSRNPEEIVRDIRHRVATGHQEVVVTGVQISSYRAAGLGLHGLVARVLAETEVARLRLTSIAPWQFDQRLLDLFAGGRLCRHFHLSLQSGSDATLRRMRRPYTAARFAELVGAIERRLPGVAITTDVIVGFPGETADEFEESLAFVADQRFSRIHAFPYSARPGTEAAAQPGQVEPREIKERMVRALAVARESAATFARSQIGETVPVLWEGRRRNDWLGTSDNYLRVKMRSDRNLRRRLAQVLLLDAEGDLVRGAGLA